MSNRPNPQRVLVHQAMISYVSNSDMPPRRAQAAAEAAAGSGGAAPPAPEVNDLLDAAKYGDMEAVEDFIAIGKDVNMKDDVGRTPLVQTHPDTSGGWHQDMHGAHSVGRESDCSRWVPKRTLFHSPPYRRPSRPTHAQTDGRRASPRAALRRGIRPQRHHHRAAREQGGRQPSRCVPLTALSTSAPTGAQLRRQQGWRTGLSRLPPPLPTDPMRPRADSKDNTPLHYAAGYGREAAVALLLDAGADVSVTNSTGKTAADLAKLDERNPLSKNAELLARMEA